VFRKNASPIPARGPQNIWIGASSGLILSLAERAPDSGDAGLQECRFGATLHFFVSGANVTLKQRSHACHARYILLQLHELQKKEKKKQEIQQGRATWGHLICSFVWRRFGIQRVPQSCRAGPSTRGAASNLDWRSFGNVSVHRRMRTGFGLRRPAGMSVWRNLACSFFCKCANGRKSTQAGRRGAA
jgi:hypothetical protein